jgi:hypothetical protein
MSGRLRKQLQDESITGYHYCIGPAEPLLAGALAAYQWDKGYPFWGGRQQAERLFEGSDDHNGESNSQSGDNEDAPAAEGAAEGEDEGPESVLLGALQLLLPRAADKAMELDAIQLHLLQTAQNAMNQFIVLLSDPTSPMVLEEVNAEMCARPSSAAAAADLDRAVSAKLSPAPAKGTKAPPFGVQTQAQRASLSLAGRGQGQGPEQGEASATLLQRLLETQDKLMRAQIRLQIYQKLQGGNERDALSEEEGEGGSLVSDSESESMSDDSYAFSQRSSGDSASLDSYAEQGQGQGQHSSGAASPSNSVFSEAGSEGDGSSDRQGQGQKARKVVRIKNARQHRRQHRADSDKDNGSGDTDSLDDEEGEEGNSGKVKYYDRSAYSSDSDDRSGEDAPSGGGGGDGLSQSGSLSSSAESVRKKRHRRRKDARQGQGQGGGQGQVRQREIPMELLEARFTELDDILTNLAGEDYAMGTLLDRSCALIPYEMQPRASMAAAGAGVLIAAERETIQPFSAPAEPPGGELASAEADATVGGPGRGRGRGQARGGLAPALPVPMPSVAVSQPLPDVSDMSRMLGALAAAIAERKVFEQTQVHYVAM